MGLPVGDYIAWRHEFTAMHCGGRSSWRELVQTDYVPLLNAFSACYGGTQKADNTPQSDAEALIYEIRNVVRYWELPRAYVAKVVAGKARRPWVTPDMSLDAMLAGLSSDLLRQLLMTLENRGRAINKKGSAALGIDAPARVHISRSTAPPPRLAFYHGDVVETPTVKPRRRANLPTPGNNVDNR
ncbi:MAG: hypothetical protein ACI4O9_00770 [Akkermansia sp.]